MDHALGVILMDLILTGRIKGNKTRVDAVYPFLFILFADRLFSFPVDRCRIESETFLKCLDILSGSAAENRQYSPSQKFLDLSIGKIDVFRYIKWSFRSEKVDQVMRDLFLLIFCRLRRTYRKVLIYLHGIAADDLPGKLFRRTDRKPCLAAGSRPADDRYL